MLILIGVADPLLRGDGILSMKLPWHRLILHKVTRAILEQTDRDCDLAAGTWTQTYGAITARALDILTSWVP